MPHIKLKKFDCAINAYKITSKPQGWKLYCDEIEVQKTHSNHRKLDSEAALSHRARGRAVDGLRTQAWPLRASRRNHDPGRLPPRPASLGGLRPAMAKHVWVDREWHLGSLAYALDESV